MNENYTLVIHGGAGAVSDSYLKANAEQYHQTMSDALLQGRSVLAEGGDAVDSVCTVVRILEDSPLFNAGKGSVISNLGTCETDAMVMTGERKIGAVAGLTAVKNPILLAQKVHDFEQHDFLMGRGAEVFAKEHGISLVDQEYFKTQYRREQWERAQSSDLVSLDHSNIADDGKYGTVGAVALDMRGKMAAATSTGGMTNKKYGRVGDSPIPGAGTWADHRTCAVSATGWGEQFIRNMAAAEVHYLMLYQGMCVKKAVQQVVALLPAGAGGLIAVDYLGTPVMIFNSKTMFRGMVSRDQKPQTWILKSGTSTLGQG
ncbi:MAG: beta-aspartyl-peptidase [Zetaproteobacteria bacterium]|nr:beta-aspartyl-peptidase [Pseudobdellovibrionaceae bacterium]